MMQRGNALNVCVHEFTENNFEESMATNFLYAYASNYDLAIAD